jgi:hypothetical protein
MSNETPMDQLLADEMEDSLDNVPEAEVEEQAEPEPEAKDEPEKTEADATDPEDGSEVEANSNPEDRKDGLPPWMHARIKAADEKAQKAMAEAEDYRRRMESFMEQQRQQPQQPQQQPDQMQHVLSAVEQQNFNTRLAFSKRFAAQEFGQEEVEQALKWGRDRCEVDKHFNQQVYTSQDPVADVVKAYRMDQTRMELDQYGGDINKLVEAKLAERMSQQPDAGDTGEIRTPSQPQGRMPSNFATSSNESRGRTGTSYSGPTPLSELLK